MADVPSKEAAATLRMVRRHWFEQLTDWTRDPRTFPEEQALPLIINFGTNDIAEEAVDAWLVDSLHQMGPHAPDGDLRKLYWMDWNLRGLAAREPTVDTELGVYGAAISPAYGKQEWDYDDWRRKRVLKLLPGHGHRITFADGTGAGKTYQALLWAEDVLRARRWVFHNFQPVTDLTGEHQDRLVYGKKASDLLRAWALAPVGAKWLVIIDEPEAALRGGNTKDVQEWSTLLNFIRKMDMDIVEIWHDRAEQYRAGREASGDNFYDIAKPAHDLLHITHDGVTVRIKNVPELEMLSYDTKAKGTLNIDLVMKKVLDVLADARDERHSKELMLKILEDTSFYLQAWQDAGDDYVDSSDIRAQILKDATKFENSRGNIDPDLVYDTFRSSITVSQSRAVAKAINRERREEAAA